LFKRAWRMVTICYQKVLTINQLKFCAKGMNQITLEDGMWVRITDI
jgi:hypothetical protein